MSGASRSIGRGPTVLAAGPLGSAQVDCWFLEVRVGRSRVGGTGGGQDTGTGDTGVAGHRASHHPVDPATGEVGRALRIDLDVRGHQAGTGDRAIAGQRAVVRRRVRLRCALDRALVRLAGLALSVGLCSVEDRDGDGNKDTDNENDDHELYEREALLLAEHLHEMSLLPRVRQGTPPLDALFRQSMYRPIKRRIESFLANARTNDEFSGSIRTASRRRHVIDRP